MLSDYLVVRLLLLTLTPAVGTGKRDPTTNDRFAANLAMANQCYLADIW